ncbi:MAG: hypothetical protein ACR2MG_04540 [Pyrinomonadaceae bacterium]
MNEILENQPIKTAKEFDSCVFELPQDFAVANGLPENSFAILTLKDSKVEAKVFSPTAEDENEVEEFLEEFGDFNEEMKRLGD